jgi:hypothetical protein
MDPAMETPPARPILPAALAGLEAGMLGAMWMLLWLGMSATLQNRSFWMPENLMATAFHRDALIAPGFGWSTFTGTAVYLLIYSLLGAAFAAAVRGRVTRVRDVLLCVTFALAWYYFSFHWVFRTVMPTVALLHVERATLLGHLIYGTVLGRYPVYLRQLEATLAAPVVEPIVTEIREEAPPTLE